MLFSSFTFLLVFLPVAVVLFWLVPRGLPRLTYLVVISCVFYGLWDWRYVPLLLAATLVDWVAGHYIARAESPRRREPFSPSPSPSTSVFWPISSTAASSWVR